jgi:hypothetical protein
MKAFMMALLPAKYGVVALAARFACQGSMPNDTKDVREARQEAINGSRLLLEALRDEHGEQGRADKAPLEGSDLRAGPLGAGARTVTINTKDATQAMFLFSFPETTPWSRSSRATDRGL